MVHLVRIGMNEIVINNGANIYITPSINYPITKPLKISRANDVSSGRFNSTNSELKFFTFSLTDSNASTISIKADNLVFERTKINMLRDSLIVKKFTLHDVIINTLENVQVTNLEAATGQIMEVNSLSLRQKSNKMNDFSIKSIHSGGIEVSESSSLSLSNVTIDSVELNGFRIDGSLKFKNCEILHSEINSFNFLSPQSEISLIDTKINDVMFSMTMKVVNKFNPIKLCFQNTFRKSLKWVIIIVSSAVCFIFGLGLGCLIKKYCCNCRSESGTTSSVSSCGCCCPMNKSADINNTNANTNSSVSGINNMYSDVVAPNKKPPKYDEQYYEEFEPNTKIQGEEFYDDTKSSALVMESSKATKTKLFSRISNKMSNKNNTQKQSVPQAFPVPTDRASPKLPPKKLGKSNTTLLPLNIPISSNTNNDEDYEELTEITPSYLNKPMIPPKTQNVGNFGKELGLHKTKKINVGKHIRPFSRLPPAPPAPQTSSFNEQQL